MFTKRCLVRMTLIFVFVLLAAITSTVAQDATPNPDAVEGAAMYEAGDYAAALPLLREAAHTDYTDTETQARYLFAVLYTGQFAEIEFPYFLLQLQAPDAFAELVAHGEAILEESPDDLGAAIAVAGLLVDGQNPAGQAAIDRVFSIDPDNAYGYDLLAYQGFYSGDGEAGREAAELALEIEPENAQLIVDLAFPFAWALNDPDRAVELLTEAITLLTDDDMSDVTLAEAYADRAQLHFYDLDEPASALDDINRAIELNPRNFRYLNGRASFHEAAEDYASAMADYEQAISMAPVSPSARQGIITTALATGLPMNALIDNLAFVEAESSLTLDAPYSGEMTDLRIVGVPLEVEAGEFTVTVEAEDVMTLDPALIITDGDNVPLAYQDDMDGEGSQQDGAYNAQITFTAEAGTSYIAYIIHSGAGSEGGFTVTLEPAAS